MKADEKIQRQLAKEEKQRIIAQNKKIQREENAQAKRLAKEEARIAREAQKKTANTRKSMRNTKEKRIEIVLDEDSFVGVNAGPAKDGVAQLADSRPRRTKRRPKYLDDYSIDLD